MLTGRAGTYAENHRDQLAVAAVALLTSVLYVARLGFYNDDWSYLSAYANAPHKDLWTLIRASWSPITYMRPVAIAYHSALYWAFGTAPLGYHLVNAVVFAASGAMLNRLLGELGFGRRRSFAVAMIWATLPHASTIRLWYTAFPVGLSIAMAFAAILCEIRAVRRRNMGWRMLSFV